MVKRLEVQDFKVGGRQAFAFSDRVSVLEGEVGASRSVALDAFRLFLAATRNADTGCIPGAWIAEGRPTRLSVSVATSDHPELTYAVAMSRQGGETRVLDERVTAGEREVLSRSGGHYRAGAPTRGRLRIGDTHLAVCEAAGALPAGDPVNDMRRELRGVWLVAPDAFRMGSGVTGGEASAPDTAFARLAAYIALRVRASETVRRAMADCLGRLGAAEVTGFSVKADAEGRPLLFVRHRNDLDAGGVPFGRLDNGEKMLFLAAFVCAVNEGSAPLSVVWDSPTNWLGARGGAAVLRMLRRSFARRGQLVMLA